MIVVVSGQAMVPLYDGRRGSKTFGQVKAHNCGEGDLRSSSGRLHPARVCHGYRTTGREAAIIVNFPDQVHDPAHPDEHRTPHATPDVSFDCSV